MKNGLMFLLTGLLFIALIPTANASGLTSHEVDLKPMMLSKHEALSANAGGSQTGLVPRRDDEGPHDIAYDDGEGWFFYPFEGLWGRVRFTVDREFEMRAIKIMVNNPNNIESEMEVYLYAEDDDDLEEVLWETTIDEPADREWMVFEMDEEDYITWDAEDMFSIVYGRAPGGNTNDDRDAGWNVYTDQSETEDEASYLGIGNDPPEQHRDWRDNLLDYDLMCRANGEYVGEGDDLGILTFDNDVDMWTALVDGDGVQFRGEVINNADDVERFILSFWVEDMDGDEVWASETFYQDGLEGDDDVVIEAEDLWVPEEAGHYVAHVLVTPMGEELFEVDNSDMFEMIALNASEDVPDNYAGYNEIEDPSDGPFDQFGDPFMVGFEHPGGEEALSLAAFRFMFSPAEGMEAGEEIDAVVYVLTEDGLSDVIYEATIESESDESHWLEVVLDSEDYVDFWEGQWILPGLYLPEGAGVQLDVTEPVTVTSREDWGQVTYIRNEDDNQFYYLNAADVALEIKTVASSAVPEGKRYRILPEELAFGYGIPLDTDSTLVMTFESYGSETVSVTTFQLSADANEVFTISPTEFEIESGMSQEVEVTFNSPEMVDFDMQVRIVSDSDEPGRLNQYPIQASNMFTLYELDPDELDFGEELDAGADHMMEITFSAWGIEDLEVSSIDIPEDAAEYFSIDNTQFDLAPGEMETVTVTFNAPENTGVNTFFTINTNAQNMPEAFDMLVSAATGLSVNENTRPGLPHAHSLAQNFPNPFNPTTSIDFALASAGEIEFLVFDMSGRIVKEVHRGFTPAGYHTVEIDASDLSAGIYLYRLKTSEFSDTKKMILVR